MFVLVCIDSKIWAGWPNIIECNKPKHINMTGNAHFILVIRSNEIYNNNSTNQIYHRPFAGTVQMTKTYSPNQL